MMEMNCPVEQPWKYLCKNDHPVCSLRRLHPRKDGSIWKRTPWHTSPSETESPSCVCFLPLEIHVSKSQTPGTQNVTLFGDTFFKEGAKVKRGRVGWSPMAGVRERSAHRQARREGCAEAHGEGGCPRAREGGLGRNQPPDTLISDAPLPELRK